MYNLLKNRKTTITATLLIFAFFAVPNASGQWVKVSDTNVPPVTSMASDGGVILAGTSYGAFYSADSGSTWTLSNGIPNYMCVRSFAVDDTIEYVAVIGGIFKSSDFGKDWTFAGGGSPYPFYSSSICANGNLLFAGTDGNGVLRSTDGGDSWDSVNIGLPTNGYASPVFFFGTKAFANDYGGEYISDDSGRNWISSGLVAITTYFAISSTLFVGGYDRGSALLTSTDTGSSWTKVPLTLPPIENIDALGNFDTVIVAATNEGNVFTSNDNGISGSNFNDGLTDTINSLAVEGRYLFGGSDNGIWRRPLSDFNQSGVAESTAANSNNAIQVFPNPASKELQIMGGQTGEVHLFDLMGRERMNAATDGNGATLDVSHLEDGMYFLRLGNESAKVEIAH
jgi:photosystem II stability/assembly factor-like uncharacterized protein